MAAMLKYAVYSSPSAIGLALPPTLKRSVLASTANGVNCWLAARLGLMWAALNENFPESKPMSLLVVVGAMPPLSDTATQAVPPGRPAA